MASNGDPTDAVQKFIDKHRDSLGSMGFGGFMGYCSGMAFRKVGRTVGVMIGIGFMGLQTAKSLGYVVDIDWDKIRDEYAKPLDANHDGKLDAKDVEMWWKRSQTMLKDNIPEAGGFSAGFLLGARRG